MGEEKEQEVEEEEEEDGETVVRRWSAALEGAGQQTKAFQSQRGLVSTAPCSLCTPAAEPLPLANPALVKQVIGGR